MTIEKHGKGYRIRQMQDGKLYVVKLDHRPTNAEAVRLMAEALGKPSNLPDMAFSDATVNYIDSRKNVLSPSTIRAYNGISKALPEPFAKKRIYAITNADVQSVINQIAKEHSPKTVRNYSGLISAVLSYHGIRLDSPRLPQKKKAEAYIPTEEDVKKIFEKLKGTKYEVPIMLAAMGLRRSEICALEVSDIDGTMCHINKALVEGPDGFTVKGTKTTDSTRTIILPEYLVERIRQQGYVFDGFPSTIGQALRRVQKELGIPPFGLHKLRHFFASYMHHLGYSDKQIQDMGGWKTPDILRTVYQHSMELEEAKKSAASDMGKLMDS